MCVRACAHPFACALQLTSHILYILYIYTIIIIKMLLWKINHFWLSFSVLFRILWDLRITTEATITATKYNMIANKGSLPSLTITHTHTYKKEKHVSESHWTSPILAWTFHNILIYSTGVWMRAIDFDYSSITPILFPLTHPLILFIDLLEKNRKRSNAYRMFLGCMRMRKWRKRERRNQMKKERWQITIENKKKHIEKMLHAWMLCIRFNDKR